MTTGLGRTGICSLRAAVCCFLFLCAACAGSDERLAAQNSLHQQTGQAGSTIPRGYGSSYPNTAGNIVAPPGNPGGNAAGAPPLVGGNMNQEGGWPEGR